MWLLANVAQHASSHYDAGNACAHGHGSRGGADAGIHAALAGSLHVHHSPLYAHHSPLYSYAHQHHPIATDHRLGALGTRSSGSRVQSPAKTLVLFRHVEKTGGSYIALTLTLA